MPGGMLGTARTVIATRTEGNGRRPLDLQGRLFVAKDRQGVKALAVSVSRQGLAVVMFESVAAHTEMILLVRKREVPLRVLSSKADPTRDGIFHAVLGVLDPKVNVQTLLAVDWSKADSEGNGPSKSTQAGRAAFNPDDIHFEDLHQAIKLTRAPDLTIFQDGRLAKLALTYHSYPITVAGVALHVFLPKNLKAAAAAALSDEEATAKSVFVLRLVQDTYVKVWPRQRS